MATANPLPSEMTAIEIHEPGGPEVLRPTRLPIPELRPGEVLIEVAAAGVNRPDVLQRQGAYPPPAGASPLPGLEVAGTIVATNPNTGNWSIGDQVCALVAGGGYAQYCAAPAPQCLHIPEGLSMIEAAALPETFFTVWTNLFQRGRLTSGETVLIHGGSSGIGTTAIQLAKAAGATVIATAGSDDKCVACRELGADLAINYKSQDFVAEVAAATNSEGVNVVLDMVGGDYLSRNLKSLAVDGRHVSIAFLAGPKAELDLRPVMVRRLTLTGSTLRPRTVDQKAAIAEELHAQVWPLLENGTVRPVIHETMPLEQASRAHALMETSSHIGKIMLEV
ncbi:MAG: NAD(P)H-quinone oxidoreductase [Pseudomonadota bacterium]